MPAHRIFAMPFASVYSAYVNKVERKGRSKEEVNRVILWLTGYAEPALWQQIERKTTIEAFFAQAPALNPNRSKITGTICGVRIEEVEDPLMQMIRQLDKLVDEVAKGRAIDKILRQ